MDISQRALGKVLWKHFHMLKSSAAQRNSQLIWKGVAMPNSWYTAGTEGTGEYIVTVQVVDRAMP